MNERIKRLSRELANEVERLEALCPALDSPAPEEQWRRDCIDMTTSLMMMLYTNASQHDLLELTGKLYTGIRYARVRTRTSPK